MFFYIKLFFVVVDLAECIPGPPLVLEDPERRTKHPIRDTIATWLEGNDGINKEFDGYQFSHSEKLRKMFCEVFGLKTFRPNQLQPINASLLDHDCFALYANWWRQILVMQVTRVDDTGHYYCSQLAKASLRQASGI